MSESAPIARCYKCKLGIREAPTGERISKALKNIKGLVTGSVGTMSRTQIDRLFLAHRALSWASKGRYCVICTMRTTEFAQEIFEKIKPD